MSQNTFSGDLVSDAISLLKEHGPQKGYWLAFSGGKDSIVIYDLAVRAGVKFTAHFNKTTVDPPQVIDFIKKYYPEVVWERPKKSMFQIIVDHGTPPTRFRRYCCRELKEIGGRGETVILGIRAAESTRRKNRKPIKTSLPKHSCGYRRGQQRCGDPSNLSHVCPHNSENAEGDCRRFLARAGARA